MSNAKKLMQGASGVSTGGKTVAIVTGADNAAAIDISDVTNMSLISSVTIEAALSQWSALDTTNNILFATGGIDDNIAAIDISNTSSMSQLQSFKDASNLDFTKSVVCDPANELAFVGSASDNKIVAIDYSTPSNMSVAATIADSDDTAGAIDPDNRILFFGNGDISSFSYTIAGAMTFLDSVGVVGSCHEMALDTTNNQLYIVNESGGAIIAIDVSNTSNLVNDDTHTLGGRPVGIGIDIDAQVAIVLDTDGGKLHSIDISTPTSMSTLDTLTDSDLSSTSDYGSVELDTSRKIAFVVSRFPNQKIIAVSYSNSSSLSKLGDFTNTKLYGSGLVLLD